MYVIAEFQEEEEEEENDYVLCVLGDFDGEDSSNSKLFRNFPGIDKKAATNKDSMNSTDNDIMVRSCMPMHSYKF